MVCQTPAYITVSVYLWRFNFGDTGRIAASEWHYELILPTPYFITNKQLPVRRRRAILGNITGVIQLAAKLVW